MASTVTIAPSLGSALLMTQGGTGASPGYSAIDIRRLMQASGCYQEGVIDSGTTSWKVSERGAGTNMSVDIAANIGLAAVKGDSVGNQGLYIVAPHSAVVNLDGIAANSSGNPRKDYIVLQVRDSTHDASGSYDARLVYLTGTATSGATQDNTSGAPSIPNGALLIAQLLVPTGTTTAVTNSMIRDRRPRATGVVHRILRNANASAADDYTTSSTSLTTIDATNVAARIECTGNPIRISFPPITGNGSIDVAVDAAYLDGATSSGGHAQTNSGGATPGVVTLVPSAGSHLLVPSWRVTSATASLVARAIFPAIWLFEELRPVTGVNGTT